MPTDKQWEVAIEMRDKDITELRAALTKALDAWDAVHRQRGTFRVKGEDGGPDPLSEELRTKHLNAGWKKKVLMWDWHKLSIDGRPGWDRDGDHPPFVKLTIKKGKDKSSSDIANEWDDVSKGRFYCRDWTNDGIPFVNDDETYWAGFWFQKRTDRDRFLKKYGGQVEPADTARTT